MKPKKSFIQYVEDIKQAKGSISEGKVKEMIPEAIQYFELNSKVYFNELGNKDVLYIASMAEENILNRIVRLMTEDDENTIESLYEGYIERRH